MLPIKSSTDVVSRFSLCILKRLVQLCEDVAQSGEVESPFGRMVVVVMPNAEVGERVGREVGLVTSELDHRLVEGLAS